MTHLVIGIGNPFRRDDGVGIRIAEAVAAAHMPGCEVQFLSGEGAALMDCWSRSARVIVLDAVRSGTKPGRIHEIDAVQNHVACDFFHYSSHAFGLAEAIEMSRTLGQLPDSLLVLGVEGEDFSEGIGLSPEVAASADKAVARICGLLKGEIT